MVAATALQSGERCGRRAEYANAVIAAIEPSTWLESSSERSVQPVH